MVLTVYKYNGVWIRTPGGLLASDPSCCCNEVTCCCLDGLLVDDLLATFLGAITGSGTITLVSSAEGYCKTWQGTISMDADGDCGGDVIQLDVELRCAQGSTDLNGIEVSVSGASATCSAVIDQVEVADSTCDPLYIKISGHLEDILPGGCSCGDLSTFTIEITVP